MDHLARSRLNFFTTAGLDRLPVRRADEGWLADQLDAALTRLVPVWRGLNLFAAADTTRPLFINPRDLDEPADSDYPRPPHVLLGGDDEHNYFAVALDDADDRLAERLERGRFLDLRSHAAVLNARDGSLLAYAKAMTYWHRRHRYCGDCGSATHSLEGGHVLLCRNSDCGQRHFPRTDPAVIVLVTRGDRCLLGHQAGWPEGLYSALAGFVEPGETLEDAVVREVYEEAGVEVSEVHYHSSQPWPFPGSIMIGFHAGAATEAIHRHDQELADARWFTHAELEAAIADGWLKVPRRVSIAYRLLEAWFDATDPGALDRVLAR